MSDFDAVVLWDRHDRMTLLKHQVVSDGIHFAMDFSTANTRSLLIRSIRIKTIGAKDKDIIVIGGGDTEQTVSAHLCVTAVVHCHL